MQLDGIRYHLKRHWVPASSSWMWARSQGSWRVLMKAQSEGRQGTSSPTQAFFGHLHILPMWRVPFVLKITWMILGEGYKSGKDFWMLILNSKEQTLQRVMFSKSTCNVLFKLFDVALVFYVIVFGLFANFF